MKRFLLSFVLVFLTLSNIFAQRDTEHWIAPMSDRASSSGQQVLYFSTDALTPFPVEIFHNNVVIGTVTISKGNPQTFTINDRSMIITTSDSDCFTPKAMGLYMKGTLPFFVTLRFSVPSHAEIITSKGKAGIGKVFYAANAPLTQNSSIYNFTTGIMATENNTSVTVSNYSTGVVFAGGPSPTPASLTFTLNKGQSYIITGSGSNSANGAGFIGAKIVADKPVSVTNGNMNGQFAIATSFGGSDIVMDQSVPTERLGDEFVLVKGNGNIGTGMEGALIIATVNNTQIFINGSTTPAATINEGQFYRINDDMWVNQLSSGHYNMHIKTSNKAYVYQLLAGVAANSATLGYNYVPPLNCFLPRKIDEIGKIGEMPGITPEVKLNILTEAGSTVTVNNNPIPATQGPFPVTGTTAWVSYTVPNVSGNVTVQSTNAVTAGVIGGSGVYGYGGYFAGFNSVPVIAKQTGECIPGIILEVDSGYDTYQWYLNGVAIPGATSNTYTPTVAGNYTVKVTMGSCQPLTTPIFKVFNCLKETVKNLNICGSTTIIPAFTSSSQTPVAGTVTIITQPTHGTATLNPATGVITYVPTPGYLGPDTIVYQFCGNALEFVDCEKVTLNLTLVPFTVSDKTISACQYDDKASFDLTSANIIDYTGVTKTYYPTLNDLNTNQNVISNPTAYLSAGGFVYVKVTTPEGCKANAKITLIAIPIKKSPTLVDKVICIDGRTDLDAGPGYSSYLWNTGATTSSIQGVPVGEYWVKLENNGCFVQQIVKVSKAQEPVITSIDITNTTATVMISGGKAPYKYAVDSPTNWQDSNVFTGLTRGQHIFYVKDSYDCTPVAVEITVPNLINAITPNGDNVNDYIDYSELKYKDNLSFIIYDRYGNKIFKGDKFNNYKWNGKFFEKKVVTGTYWYHINWNEPNKEKTPIKYTGWILVKNRE